MNGKEAVSYGRNNMEYSSEYRSEEVIEYYLESLNHFLMDNLVIINGILALVIIFFQRRSPQTVWTWLLLLYFIPILDAQIYSVSADTKQ